MRSSWLGAFVLLACSGSPARPTTTFDAPKKSETTPVVPPNSYVVVDPVTTLRTEPNEAAEQARVIVSPTQAKKAREDDTNFSLFRYVSETDGWVQLESIPSAIAPRNYKCTESLESLRSFRLALYVKREGLAEVTKRRVRVSYGDGSAVTLVGGVVLHPREDGLGGHVVRVDHLAFPIVVPSDAVDRTFVPGAPFNDTAQALGSLEGSFHFAGSEHDDTVFEGAMRSVYESRRAGKDAVATLRSACAQYEVVVAPKQVDEEGQMFGGLGLSGIGAGSASYLKQGATLYWRSGKKAGITTEQFKLPWGGTKKAGSTRPCFAHVLAGEGEKEETIDSVSSYLLLCYDPKDVV